MFVGLVYFGNIYHTNTNFITAIINGPSEVATTTTSLVHGAGVVVGGGGDISVGDNNIESHTKLGEVIGSTSSNNLATLLMINDKDVMDIYFVLPSQLQNQFLRIQLILLTWVLSHALTRVINKDLIRLFRTYFVIKKLVKTVKVHSLVVTWNVLVGWMIVIVKPN